MIDLYILPKLGFGIIFRWGIQLSVCDYITHENRMGKPNLSLPEIKTRRIVKTSGQKRALLVRERGNSCLDL